LVAGAATGRAAEPDAASSAKPTGVGFDIANMDPKADSCVYFYQYTCGGWTARNPIPPDQPRWGRFDELAQRNREAVKGILEKVAADNPKPDPIDQKIGDLYASCMDEAAVEAKGVKALQPELDRIAAIQTKDDLARTLAHLHGIGANGLFR